MGYQFNPFTGNLDIVGDGGGGGGGSGDITAVGAGTGLSGGGTSGAVTLNLANTAVAAGSYTYGSFTVDAQGRITSASSGTAPVTSVAATGPISSSGGTTPTISTSMAGNRLLGRSTAGTGVAEEISIGTGLSLTGGTLSSTGGGGGPVYYNRRPALHRGPLFTKPTSTTLQIVAGAVLNGQLYPAATTVTLPGSHTSNTDYAIWQHPSTGALVADASFTTAPAGATGGSIVGGYHWIPSGRPTAFNNGSPTATAEILEYSIWDLTWRPGCPDPRGMACIDGAFWIDLYFTGSTSYAGSTFSAVPSSKIDLTIADGSSPPLVPAQYGGDGSTNYGSFTWYEASEMATSFGKRLPFYAEFAAAAYGAPEAGSRGSDPGTVIWERVSKFGLAQATGTLWVWGADTSGNGSGGSWSASTEGRGSVYSTDTRAVLLGGNWGNSSSSGSRCAAWSGTPWNSLDSIGSRFAAVALVLG